MTAEDEFLLTLRGGLKRCRLDGNSILIGLSGGADSVALFRGLIALQSEFRLNLHVGHLNHGLRGPASNADAAWVSELCRRFQIRVETEVANLDPRGNAIEESARNARHRFLESVAIRIKCDVITTAHTADDQVETVLHHLFRGSGITGIRGIPWERHLDSKIRVVRPMLAIHRNLIEAYLKDLGQDFRTDETNIDIAMTRNWLRHHLLPDLRDRFGGRVDASVLRLSEQAQEVEQTLQILAAKLLDAALLDLQPAVARLNVRSIAEQPIHLVRELFCELWRRQNWPRQSMGYNEWTRLAELVVTPGSTNLPGRLRARHDPPGLMVIEKTDQ